MLKSRTAPFLALLNKKTREGFYLIATVGLLFILFSFKSSYAADWENFGKDMIRWAPVDVQNGSDLEKAKWIFSKVGDELARQNIPPNASLSGRIRSAFENLDMEAGTCGDVAGKIEKAFKGAGLNVSDSFFIQGNKDTWNIADVNRDHGTLALILNGKTYVFDLWQHGYANGHFGSSGDSKWNGMDIYDWEKEMHKQGYVRFSTDGGTTFSKNVSDVIAQYIQNWQRGQQKQEKTSTDDEQKKQKEYQECIRLEKESYESAVAWFPKIRNKDSFSQWVCGGVFGYTPHSAQDWAPKQCCDTYYATRDKPGMWDEAWYVLQECGWREEIKKRKELLDKKIEECRKKYPQKGVETSQQSSALVDILNRALGANIPLSQAIREISGRDAAIIGRDSSDNFYAINNRGVKIPLPGSLAKEFISNQFAVLADDSFISRALSTIPLLASSEHSTIRGTINGGGDFVYLQNQPNYIWIKENGTIKNYQLGSSIYLASSEHGSIRGTINGGGDFVKVMPEKVIETPFTQITLIGTKAVVDLGFNGITGVLVLEGQVHVKELSTNTEKNLRMGEAVLIVPGHGISNAIPVSNMNVTQWWKGSDLTVTKSDIPDTTYSGTWEMQDANNKLKGTLTLYQEGSKIQGIATFERGTVKVEGGITGNELPLTFIYDNYLGLTNFVSEKVANQIVGITSKAVLHSGKDTDKLEGTLYAWQLQLDNYDNVTARYEGGSPEANRLNPPRGFNLVRSKEQKPVSTAHKGIWIEAEDEIESYVSPVRPAANTKEINPKWRPPYFSSGCWYLAAGGECLKYKFSVPKDGLYYVWIRDYVDDFQPKGVRRVIVEFDGRPYGTFPEVSLPTSGGKSLFGWHRIGSGTWLALGEHTMKITKEATTQGAAIIDAYYLTTDPNDVPSEKDK